MKVEDDLLKLRRLQYYARYGECLRHMTIVHYCILNCHYQQHKAINTSPGETPDQTRSLANCMDTSWAQRWIGLSKVLGKESKSWEPHVAGRGMDEVKTSYAVDEICKGVRGCDGPRNRQLRDQERSSSGTVSLMRDGL